MTEMAQFMDLRWRFLSRISNAIIVTESILTIYLFTYFQFILLFYFFKCKLPFSFSAFPFFYCQSIGCTSFLTIQMPFIPPAMLSRSFLFFLLFFLTFENYKIFVHLSLWIVHGVIIKWLVFVFVASDWCVSFAKCKPSDRILCNYANQLNPTNA